MVQGTTALKVQLLQGPSLLTFEAVLETCPNYSNWGKLDMHYLKIVNFPPVRTSIKAEFAELCWGVCSMDPRGSSAINHVVNVQPRVSGTGL